METFETYFNKQKINVKVIKKKGLVNFDGEIAFSLKKKDDYSDFKVLNSRYNATLFEKSLVVNYHVIEINSVFAVTEELMSKKENIRKATLLEYKVFDRDTRSTYFSSFQDYEDEYGEFKDNIFSIRKRILISFKGNVLANYKAFVSNLNL